MSKQLNAGQMAHALKSISWDGTMIDGVKTIFNMGVAFNPNLTAEQKDQITATAPFVFIEDHERDQ